MRSSWWTSEKSNSASSFSCLNHYTKALNFENMERSVSDNATLFLKNREVSMAVS